MKAKDLAKILLQFPDRDVILQNDSEGNGYNLVGGYWCGIYNREYDEVGLEKLTSELIEEGYTESDIKEGEPSIFLVP